MDFPTPPPPRSADVRAGVHLSPLPGLGPPPPRRPVAGWAGRASGALLGLSHSCICPRPPPRRDKFNQQLLWPPEGPRCAVGWRGSGHSLPWPRGCRAELRTKHRPAPDNSRRAGTRSPPASSLSPNSPCPPHHSRAAETTTGPVSRGGRGQRSAGEGNRGGGQLYPRAQAPAPAPKTLPQPLPTPPRFPTSPRQPHQELRLGGGLV